MEDDIFPELCIMNAKKTYSKPFRKQLRPAPKSNNMKKAFRPAEKAFDPGVPLTTKVAVEYLLNGKLKTTVCRYCLKVTPGLSELDQIMQIAGAGVIYKVTIRQMIACFYPYKAGQDQNFPEKICQRCLDKALNAYLFTQQCEQAERALHNCFNDMDEKLGKLDPIDGPKKRGRQKLNPNFNILHAEHAKVMDYAEPVRNIINIQTESLSKEPDWNEFECKKCWQVLPNAESLLNHEKIHPKYMWYHCRLCGKSFVKYNQLKKHFNYVHVRGKESNVEADKTFRCKECGNVTENYVQHLQHVEKHKLKSVMKHLIEKKTNQLCLICLKKSTDLVELDKMVCIHGSCPELVGDKTLYTVLASTLPDPKSYKYQELHVPHKAKIMSINKRKRKFEEIQNIPYIKQIQFHFSSPKIVTKDKFKSDDFYYYVFCDPQADNCVNSTSDSNIAVMDTESPRIVEIIDEKPMDIIKDTHSHDKILTNGKEKKIGDSSTDKIPSSDKKLAIVGNYNEKIEMPNDDNVPIDSNDNCDENKKVLVKERAETHLLETKLVYKIRTNTEPMNLIDKFYPDGKTSNQEGFKPTNIPIQDGPINEKLDLNLIFGKTSDKSNLFSDNKDNGSTDVIDTPKPNEESCKFCWIFKHSKCEYCKKSTKKTKEDNQNSVMGIVTDNLTKDNIEIQMNSCIDSTVLVHTKPDQIEKNAKQQKVEKIWQCNICLMNNNKDRSTCHCCESKKYIENGNCKVIFENKNTFFDTAHQKVNKDEINIEKEVDLRNLATSMGMEEASMSVAMQENIEIQMDTNNTYTTQNMDVETDSSNSILNTKVTSNEAMDVEEDPISNTLQKFDPTPINMMAANIVPYAGTNVTFNIGSQFKEPARSVRKVKRAVRNIPKASHK